MRLSLPALLLLATCALAQHGRAPDTEDERAFVFGRHVKTILDPDSEDIDFRMSIGHVMAQANVGNRLDKAVDCLQKATRLYKGRRRDRYVECQSLLLYLAVGERGVPAARLRLVRKLISDQTIADVTGALAAGKIVPDHRGMGDLRHAYVNFLGAMGERAKGAVPALEALRDGPNLALAQAAFRAVKRIRSAGVSGGGAP